MYETSAVVMVGYSLQVKWHSDISKIFARKDLFRYRSSSLGLWNCQRWGKAYDHASYVSSLLRIKHCSTQLFIFFKVN